MPDFCLPLDWQSLHKSWFASPKLKKYRNNIIKRTGLPEQYPSWRNSLTIEPIFVPLYYSQLKGLDGEQRIYKDICDLDLSETIKYFKKFLKCRHKDMCFMHWKTIVTCGKPTKTLFFIFDDAAKGTGYIRSNIFIPFGKDERLWYFPWDAQSVAYVRQNTHKHFKYFIDLNRLSIYKSNTSIDF